MFVAGCMRPFHWAAILHRARSILIWWNPRKFRHRRKRGNPSKGPFVTEHRPRLPCSQVLELTTDFIVVSFAYQSHFQAIFFNPIDNPVFPDIGSSVRIPDKRRRIGRIFWGSGVPPFTLLCASAILL